MRVKYLSYARLRRNGVRLGRYGIIDTTGKIVSSSLLAGFSRAARAFRWRPVSSISLLRRAPHTIAREIRGRAIVPLGRSPRPKYHHRYRFDGNLVLHVYSAAIHSALRRSIPDRWQLQKEASFPGLPRLKCAEDDGELIWIIEDRLFGSPGTWDEKCLFEAIEWLCQFATLTGPPLRTTPFWDAHQAESIETAPADLGPFVADAWDLIGDVLAGPLHGDVQPKNLVIGPHGVGLVDWEGFWRYGLPGQDIMFLATMAGPEAPTRAMLYLLSHTSNSWADRLRLALHRFGYTRDTLASALIVMLAVWALGEVRRHRRQAASNEPTPFRDLLTQGCAVFLNRSSS
jgi:hypothetical protein